MKNTAVACGAYQFDNGKKKQLRRIILYVRPIQKTQIFLKKRKIIFICLLLKSIFKNSPGQIFGNKTKQTAFRFQFVQNIIYNEMELFCETDNMGSLQRFMSL